LRAANRVFLPLFIGTMGALISGSGCAALPRSFHLSPNAKLLQVPFFPDHADQCGPSALAGVLQFWGRPATPASVKNEIYVSHLKGSFIVDMILAAQHAGLRASIYNGSLDDVRAELGAGHPLIAFLNLGLAIAPIGHYEVIVGFDESQQKICLHSGDHAAQWMSYSRFLKDWNKTDRSTLLILPADKIKESSHDFS
jgi:ABC-type bacteriocin/lantibiotic exporter with double-glycine peptidase domain